MKSKHARPEYFLLAVLALSQASACASKCENGYVLIGNNCELKKTCDSVTEIYNSTTNTCSCNTGYVLIGGKCELKKTCDSTKEIYNAATNTCSCNTANHWTGTAGSCSCASGYYLDGDTCKLQKAVGDYITFGHYEQDNDTTNGKEPISWRILDIKDGKALVISEKSLDINLYNTTRISITWEKSTIRSWLNGYSASTNTVGADFSSDNFIDTAFTTEEKAKIVSSNVPAHENQEYSTDPGNATTDKIFLLSITEAIQYFSSDSDRQADTTRYAVKKGVYVKGSSSGEYTSNGTCTDVHCYSYWWLRSPGNYDDSAADIDGGGSFDFVGDSVDREYFAVRPALWVNL